jgi:DNA ligase-1
VIGYNPGKGKYQGMTGSLLVELPNGTRFSIGSGLTDAQRRNPPPIGSEITFKHYGWTKKGKPRFPVFWRIRK